MENLKIQKMPFMCISCSMSHVCLSCYPYVRIDISYLFVLVCTSRTRRLQIHICLLWYVINPCIFIQKNKKFQKWEFYPLFSKWRLCPLWAKSKCTYLHTHITMHIYVTYLYGVCTHVTYRIRTSSYACHIRIRIRLSPHACCIHTHVTYAYHSHVNVRMSFACNARICIRLSRMHIVFIHMSRTYVIRMSCTYVIRTSRMYSYSHIYVFIYHIRMSVFVCHIRMSTFAFIPFMHFILKRKHKKNTLPGS